MSAQVRRERWNVTILAANQTLSMVASITVMTLSGLVGLRLAPTPGLATLPISLVMVGAVATALPASMLMSRIGRRAGFVVGALAGGVSGGLVSAAAVVRGSFWMLCAGAALLGIYQAFARFHRFAAADAVRPNFQSQAISLVLAGGVAAAFLGPANASRSGGLLATPDAGPYLVIAVISLLAAALHSRLRMPPVATESSSRGRHMAVIIGQPTFVVAVVTATVAYALMTLLMTATPLAMHAGGFHVTHTASVMQWHVLGMYVPSFFSGWLMARFGLRRMLLVGTVVLVAAALVGASGQTMEFWWAALILLGIGWNFLFVGGTSLLALAYSDEERGKVQGFNEFVILSAVALASFAAGALMHAVGWTRLNLAVVPVVVAVGVLVWRMTPTPARDVTAKRAQQGGDVPQRELQGGDVPQQLPVPERPTGVQATQDSDGRL